MFGLFKKSKSEQPTGKPIGEVTHYFGNLNVAVVKVTKAISSGDKIRIKGATTDFTQVVQSMQIDHKPVETAKRGQEIGMKVKKRVRVGDSVYEA